MMVERAEIRDLHEIHWNVEVKIASEGAIGSKTPGRVESSRVKSIECIE